MALESALLEGDSEAEGHKPGEELKGGWKASIFILGCEFCEKTTHSALLLNLVVYLTTVIHQGAGQAAQTVTTWGGTSCVSSFLGAFLADAYLGRYWTIGIIYIVYACGMILFTLTAVLPSLRPAQSSCGIQDGHCKDISAWKMAFFYTALYIVGFGSGGSKACVSPFGAEQLAREGPAQMSSFFNWYYFVRNVGALIASTVIVYIQENVGWGVGYGVPTLTLLLSTFLFFIGTPWYRNHRPGGSPLTRIAQVFVAAVSKWNARVPEDDGLLYELPGEESAIRGSRKLPHSAEFRCLDKAAAQSFDHGSGPWALCTVTQVEEVKILIRLLPVWACMVVYFTAYVQMTSLFIEQGQRMDPQVLGSSFKIPPASMILFNTLAIILCIPIYDSLLVPMLRKCTGYKQGVSQLQRMTIGIFLMTLSMLVAALVESRRLQVAAELELLDNYTDPVPMSILWQVPQYFVIGVSKLFACVGQIEFFYDQAPDAMRSMGSFLALGATALGNYLSSLLVSLLSQVTSSSGSADAWIPDNLNRGHVDYFFLLLVLTAASGLVLSVWSRWYRYKLAPENT